MRPQRLTAGRMLAAFPGARRFERGETAMLEGLVQHDHPLTLQHILDRMRRLYGDSEVVTLTDAGKERAVYAEVCERIDRLCRALESLGVELGDRAAAGLCYTSGTTGNPKGVLYSHRSNVLHALASCLADSIAISHSDRVMPVVPMFHANAWGLPHASTFVGADLVMPGRFLQPEPLARLIEEERVTVAAAVPTIWADLLR